MSFSLSANEQLYVRIDKIHVVRYILPPVIGFGTNFELSESEEIVCSYWDTLNVSVFWSQCTSESKARRI